MNDKEQKTDDLLEYQIKLRGYLGPQWANWFENTTIHTEKDGNTLIICFLTDQAALYGLLKKIRDLGLFLLALEYIDPEQSEP